MTAKTAPLPVTIYKTFAEQTEAVCHAMYGRPKQIVVDSAKEFQSSTFTTGCADFGINVRTRNKGTVHRGGVVERLLGKVNTRAAVAAIESGEERISSSTVIALGCVPLSRRRNSALRQAMT